MNKGCLEKPPNDIVKQPLPWGERAAHWVSNLLSPPVIAAAALLIILQFLETASDFWWALYLMILTMLIPVIYIAWQVRAGRITDFHVNVREQRIRPLSLTLAGGLASMASLWLGQAPRLLIVLAGVTVAQIAFFLLFTLRWKISGHGAAISSLAVFVCGLYGPAAGPVLLAIPLVAWSRIRLCRHTLAQTLFGSAAGSAFSLAILFIIR